MNEQYQKIVTIPCLFNNDNLLEFSIEQDKRMLCLAQTYLRFYVELEDIFVVDNNFCNKLFEYLDINLNYEDIRYIIHDIKYNVLYLIYLYIVFYIDLYFLVSNAAITTMT
jgi:hypothetical protein